MVAVKLYRDSSNSVVIKFNIEDNSYEYASFVGKIVTEAIDKGILIDDNAQNYLGVLCRYPRNGVKIMEKILDVKNTDKFTYKVRAPFFGLMPASKYEKYFETDTFNRDISIAEEYIKNGTVVADYKLVAYYIVQFYQGDEDEDVFEQMFQKFTLPTKDTDEFKEKVKKMVKTIAERIYE